MDEEISNIDDLLLTEEENEENSKINIKNEKKKGKINIRRWN